MLDDRSRKVLKAVVQSFINNHGPIGSRYLTKKYSFGCSAATIRNIMADLEEMGFLCQPHTSAGRMPTDKGYRFYVESFVREIKGFDDDNGFSRLLNEIIVADKEDINSILNEITKALAKFSHYLGIAGSPGPEESTLKRMEIIPYNGERLAVVIFANEGTIKHKIIRNEPFLSRYDLRRIVRYINKEFSGFTIKKIKEHLIAEIIRDKAMCDTLISSALHFCRDVLECYGPNIFIAGLSEMLELPEFSDIKEIKMLSKAIEDRQAMIKLIDSIINSEGAQIVIGTENPASGMKTMSVIASAYRGANRPIGVVGIIGPTRMDYPSVISLVDTAAKFLSEINC